MRDSFYTRRTRSMALLRIAASFALASMTLAVAACGGDDGGDDTPIGVGPGSDAGADATTSKPDAGGLDGSIDGSRRALLDATVGGDDAALAGDGMGCEVTFYLDADGDGFGDPTHAIQACSKPAGYSEGADDCYDANPDVHPGQTVYFAVDRGDGSFDYNCNGVERQERGVAANCPDLSETCPPPPSQLPGQTCDYDAQVASWAVDTAGWYQDVPACGQLGVWGLLVQWSADTRSYSCVMPPAATPLRQLCQ